jgi:hypothetical protein
MPCPALLRRLIEGGHAGAHRLLSGPQAGEPLRGRGGVQYRNPKALGQGRHGQEQYADTRYDHRHQNGEVAWGRSSATQSRSGLQASRQG